MKEKVSIEKFCINHGIEEQTLMDVYQDQLEYVFSIVDNYGLYSINKERKEQVEKHGRTRQYDMLHNQDGQLRQAAISIISSAIQRECGCPKGWSQEIYNKMANKSLIDRLIISGALIAAEIDRLSA